VINVEWSGFGGEWSAKCRVEWFRRGSINVEWSVIGEVGSCTAPYLSTGYLVRPVKIHDLCYFALLLRAAAEVEIKKV
jgi:hypothetical protein